MIVNASKRFLALALALLMTIALIPEITVEVSAATTGSLSVSDLIVSASSGATWTLNGTQITGSAEGTTNMGCNGTSESTITLKNNKSTSALLTFKYTLTGGGSVSSSDGKMASGSYSSTLSSGGTVKITITSPEGRGKTASLVINSLSLVVDVQATTTFSPAENGSYTVGGTAVTAETSITQSSTKAHVLVATPASGYKFYGWYSSTSNKYLSYDASYSLYSSDNQTIYPVFISTATTVFEVKGSGQRYTLLSEAVSYAVANKYDIVVLVSNGTLPAGEYTIPAGVTLLIPFDDAYTCYTTKPVNVGATKDGLLSTFKANAYVTPTVYKS